MAFRLFFSCVVGPALVVSSGDTKETAAALPEVETVLSKASHTAEDFAAKTSWMMERVSQRQNASVEALAEQKASYEKNLTGQAEEIHSMQSTNIQIRRDIDATKNKSLEIKSDTERLRGENSVMHKVLEVLENKVVAAQDFLGDSLSRTDDDNAEALKVLLPPVPEPGLTHFLEVVHGDSKTVTSFLQLSSRVGPRRKAPPQEDAEAPEDLNPDALEHLLSESLSEIEQEQKEGEAELKAHFLKLYNAGVSELQGVQKEQDALNAEKVKEEAHQRDLKAAKEHVKETREELLRRLHGMEIFAKKVDDAAAYALESVEATTAGMEMEPRAKATAPSAASKK